MVAHWHSQYSVAGAYRATHILIAVIPIRLIISGDNINLLECLFFNIILKRHKEDIRILSGYIAPKALICRIFTRSVNVGRAHMAIHWLQMVYFSNIIQNMYFEKESKTFHYPHGLLILTSDKGWIASLDKGVYIHGQGNARPLLLPFPFCVCNCNWRRLFCLRLFLPSSSEEIPCGLAPMMCQKMPAGHLE